MTRRSLEGGATNLAYSRRTLRTIDLDIRQRFTEKQVAYVQNLHELGAWQVMAGDIRD